MSPAIITAALVLALGASDSQAEAEAKKHFEAGQLQYKLGRFEEAFEEYQRAYELAPFADLLFNMGQCQRNLKDYDRALFFFRGYVRDAKRAEDRARVNRLIEELEAERERALEAARAAEAATATTAVAVAAPFDAAAQIPGESPPPAIVVLEKPAAAPAAAAADPLYTKWWFWSAIAVVAAAAISGVAIAAAPGDKTLPPATIGTIDTTK